VRRGGGKPNGLRTSAPKHGSQSPNFRHIGVFRANWQIQKSPAESAMLSDSGSEGCAFEFVTLSIQHCYYFRFKMSSELIKRAIRENESQLVLESLTFH